MQGLAGNARRPDAPFLPDIRRPALAGAAVLALLVGGLGTWAATAPLSSAALAPGVVAVDSKRKTVQHLEGGIVDHILVREGERVAAGQPLIRLDTTQAEASWNAASGQLRSERALEARLIAERDSAPHIAFPADLERMAVADPGVRETPGGVAEPGAALMEIVPEDDKLTIDAQARPTDIDSLHAGLPAQVRLTAFKAWATPTLRGEVTLRLRRPPHRPGDRRALL
jgi:multidrug efflux pump subunit AcrA (membrane-fusion protein)